MSVFNQTKRVAFFDSLEPRALLSKTPVVVDPAVLEADRAAIMADVAKLQADVDKQGSLTKRAKRSGRT